MVVVVVVVPAVYMLYVMYRDPGSGFDAIPDFGNAASNPSAQSEPIIFRYTAGRAIIARRLLSEILIKLEPEKFIRRRIITL